MSKTVLLIAVFGLQAVCCLFFFADTLADLFWPGATNQFADSDQLEALVSIALLIGLCVTGYELRRVLTRQTHLEDQIKVASGAFGDVLQTRFAEWSLTEAERDVALLAIKGFSIAEIAGLRDTKEGTIKAQCASLYRKAGVSGRLQLLSVFLDDLMAEDLMQSARKS